MNALLPTTAREIPDRVGDRVLLSATKHEARWQCTSTVTGKVCNRTGTCRIQSWTHVTSAKRCKACIVYELRHLRGDIDKRTRKKPVGVMAEHFKCSKLDIKHTRADCAAVYARANYATGAEHVGSACTKCPIGKMHAKKEAHPDAPAIAAPVPAAVMVVPRLCLSPLCRAPLPVGRRDVCDKGCQADAVAAGVFAGMQNLGITARVAAR